MEEMRNCPDCGCSARSLAARECRASDCPLNSVNRQDRLAEPARAAAERGAAAPYFAPL
jgi:hypothetical protein